MMTTKYVAAGSKLRWVRRAALLALLCLPFNAVLADAATGVLKFKNDSNRKLRLTVTQDDGGNPKRKIAKSGETVQFKFGFSSCKKTHKRGFSIEASNSDFSSVSLSTPKELSWGSITIQSVRENNGCKAKLKFTKVGNSKNLWPFIIVTANPSKGTADENLGRTGTLTSRNK